MSGLSSSSDLRLRRQQNRAAAIVQRLVDVAVAARDGESLQRLGPVAGLALKREQRLHWPGELWIEPQGALGELALRLVLTLAAGFEKEAAQTELLGIG